MSAQPEEADAEPIAEMPALVARIAQLEREVAAPLPRASSSVLRCMRVRLRDRAKRGRIKFIP